MNTFVFHLWLYTVHIETSAVTCMRTVWNLISKAWHQPEYTGPTLLTHISQMHNVLWPERQQWCGIASLHQRSVSALVSILPILTKLEPSQSLCLTSVETVKTLPDKHAVFLAFIWPASARSASTCCSYTRSSAENFGSTKWRKNRDRER